MASNFIVAIGDLLGELEGGEMGKLLSSASSGPTAPLNVSHTKYYDAGNFGSPFGTSFNVSP